jgi:NADH-quinone oxidoreductase subunit M
MLQKVNFGEPSDEWADMELHDVDGYEMAAWVPLVLATLAIGIFPKIVFGATTDAVTAMVIKAFGG